VIKLAGGCYLLWLAYKSLRSATSRYDLSTRTLGGSPRSPLGYALRGLTIQMTNPKAALAWIAIMSLGLREGAPLWVPVSLVVGTSILSVVIHCVYAIAFSTPVMLRFYSRARRTIQATLSVLFAFAGMKLLTSRS
jgi:amino acid exporter